MLLILLLTSPHLWRGKVSLEVLRDVGSLREGLVAQRAHQGRWQVRVWLHVSLQVLFTCKRDKRLVFFSVNHPQATHQCPSHAVVTTWLWRRRRRMQQLPNCPRQASFMFWQNYLKKTLSTPSYISVSAIFLFPTRYGYISVPSQQLQAHHSDSAKILVWFIHLPDDVSNGSS